MHAHHIPAHMSAEFNDSTLLIDEEFDMLDSGYNFNRASDKECHGEETWGDESSSIAMESL